MATTKPRHDKTRRPNAGPPPDSDPGQSAERERQEQAITDASRRESWISQLLRSLRLSGRPKPGHDKKGRGAP